MDSSASLMQFSLYSVFMSSNDITGSLISIDAPVPKGVNPSLLPAPVKLLPILLELISFMPEFDIVAMLP